MEIFALYDREKRTITKVYLTRNSLSQSLIYSRDPTAGNIADYDVLTFQLEQAGADASQSLREYIDGVQERRQRRNTRRRRGRRDQRPVNTINED